MKVYKSLQIARCELQSKEIKKSGQNKFSNYDYFELQDFLPAINEIMNNNNLCSQLIIEKDKAELIVIHCEDDSKLSFQCPVVSITLKGANEIQSQGAVITYIRRYLMMMAFEIVESDWIDGNKQDNDNDKIQDAKWKLTKKESEINNNEIKRSNTVELVEFAKPIKDILPEQLKIRLTELAKEKGASLTIDEYKAIKEDLLMIRLENKAEEIK
jgi:hypothetical protein